MKKSGGCALPAIVLSNENSEWGQRQPFKGSVRRYRAPSGERPISREGKRCHAHPLYSRAFLGLRLIRHLTWQVRPLIGPEGETEIKHSRGVRTVQTSGQHQPQDFGLDRRFAGKAGLGAPRRLRACPTAELEFIDLKRADLGFERGRRHTQPPRGALC